MKVGRDFYKILDKTKAVIESEGVSLTRNLSLEMFVYIGCKVYTQNCMATYNNIFDKVYINSLKNEVGHVLIVQESGVATHHKNMGHILSEGVKKDV
ncbi:hypothetical protein ZPAH1_orf00066 [Aeromonas phage ZPAH1]|nr:hypothetical protein ZPAH1_orf00066 [Aeromonas phage ZPAH1]